MSLEEKSEATVHVNMSCEKPDDLSPKSQKSQEGAVTGEVNKSFNVYILIGVVVCVLVCLTIGLAVGLTWNNDDDSISYTTVSQLMSAPVIAASAGGRRTDVYTGSVKTVYESAYRSSMSLSSLTTLSSSAAALTASTATIQFVISFPVDSTSHSYSATLVDRGSALSTDIFSAAVNTARVQLGLTATMAAVTESQFTITAPISQETGCNLPKNPVTPAKRSGTSGTSIVNSLEDAVSDVWNDMKSWGPKPTAPKPGAANINMAMLSNSMSMVTTTFGWSTTSGRRAATTQPCDWTSSSSYTATKTGTIRWKNAPVGMANFNMFMSGNTMTMKTNTFTLSGKTKTNAQTTIESSSLSKTPTVTKHTVSTATKFGANSKANSLYMFNNQLSMSNTQFTMNVAGPSSRRAPATGPKLTINMYMCHNSMQMLNTQFTMNINGNAPSSLDDAASNVFSSDSTVQDQINLLVTALAGARGGRRSSGGPQDVFAWIQDKIAAAKNGDLEINMHMFNNTMSMTDTIFNFNVGVAATTSVSASTDKNSGQPGTSSDSTDSKKYIYNQEMSMTNTIFTMNVGGSPGGGRRAGAMNVQSLAIGMYMYNNKMDMTTTVFQWNV